MQKFSFEFESEDMQIPRSVILAACQIAAIQQGAISPEESLPTECDIEIRKYGGGKALITVTPPGGDESTRRIDRLLEGVNLEEP